METKISISVNGISVVGEICHRSSRDIVVEIIEPYQGMSKGLHIPCFGAKYSNYDGDHGIKTAQHLLKQMYTICFEAEKNAHQLIGYVNQWLTLKNEYQVKEISNKESKRVLRKEFKSGIITQTQYQNTLRAIDKEETNYYICLGELFHEKIQPYFSEIIPICSRESTVNFIKNL